MSKPKHEDRGKPKEPITVNRERIYPEYGIDQLYSARVGLTQGAVFVNNQIHRLSNNPQIVAAMGIDDRDLPLHLAHLTISYRTLQSLAFIVGEDIKTAEANTSLSVLTGPTLVDAHGNPLVN